MKKIRTILACLLICVLMLTACGGPAATSTPANDATPTPTEEAADPTSAATPTPTVMPARELTYSKQTREIADDSQSFNITLEAEDATLAGNLKTSTSRTGYSGTGYVTNFNQAAANKLTLTVDIPYSQYYNITVRAASDQYKINYLTIDNANVCEIECDGTTSKQFTDYVFYSVYIEAGTREISIKESWGWFDFDSVTIVNGGVVDPENYNGISSKLANPNANDDAAELMEYLVSIYGNYTLSGQYCTHNSSSEVEGIYKVTGKYPAVRGFDMIFCSPNSGYSNTSEINQAKTWASKGGIVSFSWHWHGPVGANAFYTKETDFRIPDARTTQDLSLVSAADLKAMYQNGEITEKQYRLIYDMDVIAFHLKALRDEGIAILWRPLHEASGGWFWWGASGAEDYIWLWQLMFKRMTYYHELNNLIWVWNAQAKDWYPGDEYVDIVGEDIYADAFDYSSQASKFRSVLGYPDTPKLTALSENGVVMDPDLCARDNVYWLWFNVWSGDFLFDAAFNTNQKSTEDEILIKAYNSEYVLTLDELPWNK